MKPASAPPKRELDAVGVMCHLVRPTLQDCADVAAAAEAAGAGWCMFPDALGWRDVWLCLGAAAAATSHIIIGPGVTNPYTRHPFVTIAALATLDEISGGRTMLGVAAGGSELSAIAGIDRSDSPDKLRSLIEMLRKAADGDSPIPYAPSIPNVPVVGGARGPQMLQTVAETCDIALLWGQTHGLLQEAASAVRGHRAAIAWAPLRRADMAHVNDALVYGVLNSPPAVRRKLGVDDTLEQQIRSRLMERGMDYAAALVPDSAVAEFVVDDDLDAARVVATQLGARHIIVQVFATADVAERVTWARGLADSLSAGD
ncbi:MAG: LLM class flavin-dependent oxidoreductase [Acidimicrobiia bacterium]|nr:LLM class flavin-dependent oxidoreductase [Acidimicrobiia bacterium]